MITKKFLYLISQTEVQEYDSYDSAVVCATSQEAARDTHPAGDDRLPVWKLPEGGSDWGTWATLRKSVKVELLGMTVATRPVGVVCASFNAG